MSKHVQKIASILGCLVIMLAGIFPTQVQSLAGMQPVQAASPDTNVWKDISPKGGNVMVVTLAPSNPSIVYIAMGGRVLRSGDGGNHWSGPGAGLPGDDVSSLAVSLSDPKLVLAGLEPAGVYKTTDGGLHWLPSNQGFGLTGRVSLLSDPKNEPIFYAYTGAGIYKTIDGGGSWQSVRQGLGSADILRVAISASDPSILYLAMNDSSIYKTTDGAAHWNLVASGFDYMYSGALAVDPRTPDAVYLGNGRGDLFKSTDGGLQWTEHSQGLPEGNILIILVDPAFPDTVYATSIGDGLYASQDAGLTWSPVAGFAGMHEPNSLAMNPSLPHMLYAGFSGYGVYRSPDGGANWKSLNRGLDDVSVRALFTNPHLPSVIYAGTNNGLLMTTSRGTQWTDLPPWTELPGIIALAVDPHDARTMYAGSDGGGVFKTVDGGSHWFRSTDGLYPLVEVATVGVDPFHPATVYAGGWDAGLYKSTDSGATWNPTGLTETVVRGLVFDPNHPQVLYAASDEGVLKSTDGGDHWTPKNTGTGATCASLVAIDPQKPSTLYAMICDRGLYKTTNSGDSWYAIGEGLPEGIWPSFVNAFAMDPQNPSILYAGEWNDGVYRSTNGGASWSKFGIGLPEHPDIQSLAVSPAGLSCVYVGLYDGVYSTCRGMPVLKGLDRSSAKTGEPGFNLTLEGDGFTEDATVRWAGDDLPVSFEAEDVMHAAIPAQVLSQPGVVDVAVSVPEPGGGVSEPVSFIVQAGEKVFLPLMIR